MPSSLPKRPRTCTHIKVTGQRCGSPALRGEFFCYFHTRVIKGVQQRVDMQLHPIALLEDPEAIQLSLMHVVDGLLKGTLDPTRARLIIQALRIAARNAKNVRFDDVHYRPSEQPMVREVPDYAQQYLIEHPEYGPPIGSQNKKMKLTSEPESQPAAESRSAGAPAREDNQNPCSADTAVRVSETNAVAEREAHAQPQTRQQNVSQESVTAEPAAERRKNAAHGASRGTTKANHPAPKERKKPQREEAETELQRVQAAIAGAERGNWRDLRTVFEFAGITTQNKDAPS